MATNYNMAITKQDITQLIKLNLNLGLNDKKGRNIGVIVVKKSAIHPILSIEITNVLVQVTKNGAQFGAHPGTKSFDSQDQNGINAYVNTRINTIEKGQVK